MRESDAKKRVVIGISLELLIAALLIIGVMSADQVNISPGMPINALLTQWVAQSRSTNVTSRFQKVSIFYHDRKQVLLRRTEFRLSPQRVIVSREIFCTGDKNGVIREIETHWAWKGGTPPATNVSFSKFADAPLPAKATPVRF